MQKFDGTLLVEEIRGRNGLFCVGTLQTSIGDFKVKDPALDQFKSGAYQGQFLVEKIYTKGVPWRGGFFTEIIAKIAPEGFLIHEEDEAPPASLPSTQAEPDPADDKPAMAQKPASTKTRTAGKPSTPKDPKDEASEADDAALFGLELHRLFVERAEIALDPTVDREQFRRQRDRLKEVGYRFDAQAQPQRWIPPAAR